MPTSTTRPYRCAQSRLERRDSCCRAAKAPRSLSFADGRTRESRVRNGLSAGGLEGDGFELSVPREEKPILRDGLCPFFFPTLPFREGPNPSAFASRNVSAGNSGTLGYLQGDPSIPQPLSGSAGDLIDHAGVRSRCVAPSPSTAWRRASRRALRCGQPACAWKWRRRHGSGEPPCMQRRFPAASCRLPGQGPDR